jgi:hypothetical protein
VSIRKANTTPRRPVRTGNLRPAETKARPRVDKARVEEKRQVERTQAETGMATRELGKGLEKQVAEVSAADASNTRNQLGELTVQARGGAGVSRRELTPEFRAAEAVKGKLQEIGDAKLQQVSDKVEAERPELKAAYDAVAPEVTELVKKTAGELRKNPEAMARVKNVVAQVGKEGFSEAVKKAAPDVGEAFSTATGVQMMNEPVVRGVLEGMPKLAEKIGPEVAEQVTKGCAAAAKKLGVETAKTVAETAVKAGADEVAEAAVKGVAKTVAKAGAEEAAEVAVKAAAKGAAKAAGKEVAEAGAKGAAKVAAKGAAGAGKAVPVVGNVIAVGSTCLAAYGFIKALVNKPSDTEKITKEGVNTLLQGVGIAFPWVALGGDLVDVGWSAKMAVQDAKKKGASPEQAKAAGAAAAKKSPLPDVSQASSSSARALASALEGAGHAGPGKAFRDLASAADDLAKADSPQARATWKTKQQSALSQLAQLSSSELKKAAAEQAPGRDRDTLETLSHGFGELFSVLYAERKASKAGGGDESKRADRAAKLLAITGDAARAIASSKASG